MKKLMVVVLCALATVWTAAPLFAQEANSVNNTEENAAVNANDTMNADESQATDENNAMDQGEMGAPDMNMGNEQVTEPTNTEVQNSETQTTDNAAMTANAEQAATTQPAEGVKAADQANPTGPAATGSPDTAGKAQAVNFGDYRSSTLVTKAWGALNQNDIESVLAYTNKCIELYGEEARKMQNSLKDYPTGSNNDIFKYWALNDVATSYYIQGEAYHKANMKDESKEAYSKLIKDYSYGQAWDPKGWFWKPAEAAKEKLAMAEAGVNLDFGDYSSNVLVQKAWGALAAKDLNASVAYVNRLVELYGVKAKEMQGSLKEYPWESKEKTMQYWALNDVGTGLFILGEAYRTAGKKEEAAQTYKKLIDEYFYAQCWDPQGWFWKPAEAAQQKLAELDNV